MRRGSRLVGCFVSFLLCACSPCLFVGLRGQRHALTAPAPQRLDGVGPDKLARSRPALEAATTAQVSPRVTATDDEQEGRVFVSVVAFSDPELPATLRALLKQARRPDLLYVGLVWQGFEGEEPLSQADVADLSELWGVSGGGAAEPYENPVLTEIFESGRLPLPAGNEYSLASMAGGHIRLLKFRAEDARGPCWARYLAQHLWAGEALYLQVDSHMRCVPRWDDHMREQLAWCSQQSEKPVLSTYGRGYTLGTPPDWDPPAEARTPGLICAGFFDNNQVLNIQSRPLKSSLENPRRNPFWSGHFSFSSSQVLREVPYDPQCLMLLFGEEPLMAARLFTHGWDVYTPSQGLLFHLWERDYRRTFFEMKQLYDELLPRTLRRVFWLLDAGPPPPADEHQEGWPLPGGATAGGEHASKDQFGLGTTRSLQEYEQFADLSYRDRRIGESALRAGLPKGDHFLVPERAPPPKDELASAVFFLLCSPVVLGVLSSAWSSLQGLARP